MAELLVIGGLEANGFAGIALDARVAAEQHLDVAMILTLSSAQSQHGLEAMAVTEPALLAAQLNCLIEVPKVVKIGVLASSRQAQIIVQWLQRLPQKPWLVVDPVGCNSGDGQRFSNEPLTDCLQPLWRYIDLLTPNHDELFDLVCDPASDTDHAQPWVAQLFQQQPAFNGQLLLTGGHSPEFANSLQVHDQLYTRLGLEAQWQQSKHQTVMRGTGCFLATSIACGRVLGYDLPDAICLASANLQRRFVAEQDWQQGWPENARCYPVVKSARMPVVNTPRFAPMLNAHGLYAIVDSADWLPLLAASGVSIVQLRIKGVAEERLRTEIATAIRLSERHGLQLFINDYWHLAIELGAYGVHLGQGDIEHCDLKEIHAAGLRLGISTHGDFEFLLAKQLRPSYLAVGAIFPTQTKDMSKQLQGLARLKRYCKLSGNTPVVAIGGINQSNIESVVACGPEMVAVVSAITQAEQPELAVRALQQAFALQTQGTLQPC